MKLAILMASTMCLIFCAGADQASKVLFIGNSLTYRQSGIYSHFEKLASSAKPARPVQIGKAVKGGATLKTLWDMPEAREAITNGLFDVVVLQEDLPEINISYFREYARKFVAEIRFIHKVCT